MYSNQYCAAYNECLYKANFITSNVKALWIIYLLLNQSRFHFSFFVSHTDSYLFKIFSWNQTIRLSAKFNITTTWYLWPGRGKCTHLQGTTVRTMQHTDMALQKTDVWCSTLTSLLCPQCTLTLAMVLLWHCAWLCTHINVPQYISLHLHKYLLSIFNWLCCGYVNTQCRSLLSQTLVYHQIYSCTLH